MEIARTLGMTGPLAALLIASACAPTDEQTDEIMEDEISVSAEALTATLIAHQANVLYAVEVEECTGLYRAGVNAQWQLPSWVTDATVIYNGFVTYGQGDRHVNTLAADSREVTFGYDHILRWKFVGSLYDDYGSASGSMCHKAIVLGWNRQTIAAQVTRAQGTAQTRWREAAANVRWVMQGQHSVGCSYGADTVAIIPQGFLLSLPWGEDHHLLQAGFRITQDQTPGECADIQIKGVLKDNDYRSVSAWMGFDVIRGAGVTTQQNAFDFVARPRIGGGCIVPSGGRTVEHLHYENLASDFVFPMLTGAEVRYPCDDEHVRNAAARISNVQWNRTTRTLDFDFTSHLDDSDGFPGHYADRQITLLGLNRRSFPVFNDGVFTEQVSSVVP